ncbi:MAG: hypothetical protein ACREJ3_14710 [Polyangiaceae bacterium]
MTARSSSAFAANSSCREYLAQWGAFCAIAFAAQAVVWIAEMVRGTGGGAIVLRWGGLFYLGACSVALAYASLWILVSCIVQTSKQALWSGLGVAFALTVVRGLLHDRAPAWEVLMPGAFDKLFLSGQTTLHWQALGMVAIGCCGALLAATWVLTRRDL